MRTSSNHILTSQSGSLPRPDDLIEANRQRDAGAAVDEQRFQEQLRAAVTDVVRRQHQIDIDIPGDGEFGKSMGHRVNYGAWWSYCFNRLGGLDLSNGAGLYELPPKRSRPGEIVLTSMADRRDRIRFPALYADPEGPASTGPRRATWPVCVGPLFYKGNTQSKPISLTSRPHSNPAALRKAS